MAMAHEPGNIFIYAPAQQALMAIDLVFPGLDALAQVRCGSGASRRLCSVGRDPQNSFRTLVGGHVQRSGTHADVDRQIEFYGDLKAAAAKALAATKPGEGLDPRPRPRTPGRCSTTTSIASSFNA